MRKQKYHGPTVEPSRLNTYYPELAPDPVTEDQAKEISDKLYCEYKYDLNYIHINKMVKTILYISYFYFDYKDYKEVVDNLQKDMYNIKYINALIIAFVSNYGILFIDKGGKIIEYDDEDELEDTTIVKIIDCILKYAKEKDLRFYPWNTDIDYEETGKGNGNIRRSEN